MGVTEATDAPATSESETNERTEAVVAAFRRQLEGQGSVPASVVQDGLLELWGSLPAGDTRSVIEGWLTETLERNLYSASEVGSRLDAVLAQPN